VISTHAPEADQIDARALQRPKSSLYDWYGKGAGLRGRKAHSTIGMEKGLGSILHELPLQVVQENGERSK
jgi:hypothetical protein